MFLSAMMQTSLAVLAAAAKNPDDIPISVVVVTGLVLVFFILFVLIAIILIQGKVFGAIDKKKQDKENAAKLAVSQVPAAPVAPVVPVVEEGIPPEVIAAIVAAISASTNGAYTLRAVTTAKKGRGAWGLAGVIQSTEPF